MLREIEKLQDVEPFFGSTKKSSKYVIGILVDVVFYSCFGFVRVQNRVCSPVFNRKFSKK
jgi:hypothetical protein